MGGMGFICQRPDRCQAVFFLILRLCVQGHGARRAGAFGGGGVPGAP
jgi:hypothetical protein